MRKFVIMAAISAQALLVSGCAAAWKNVSYSDDLYTVHNKIAIAERQKAEAELAKAQYEAEQAQYKAQQAQYAAQQAQYEAQQAQANAQAVQQGIIVGDDSTFNGYDAVLADNYDSAYARRLYGFSSPTYNMPSSYYTWRYSDAFHYASAYDPAFYNVMVSGDMVWVEPKYVTSMFGTWGATVIPSYGWYYSWNDPYYYWNSSYRWNWYYGWNNPYYWSWGCNSPYSYYNHYYYHHHHYPHHHHRPHRPSYGRPPHHDHRPPHAGSGGAGSTGHHQINRPGTVVDRNPGPSRPVDRGGNTSVRPSTPSTGRVTTPVQRVDGSSSSRPTSGSSSYRGGSSSNSSVSGSGTRSNGSSTTIKSTVAPRSYNSSSSSKKRTTIRSTSSSSSSSYRSSGSSSSYRSSGSSSSSRSYSSPSSSSSHSSSSRSSYSGGNSRGR